MKGMDGDFLESAEADAILVFAGYCLDPRRRRLTRPDGLAVHLTSRAFDTLHYLVRHPHEVIDKQRLMRAVWPDHIVEENNLNQQISMLRKILGEAGDPFIVTDFRRGYRFVQAVRSCSGGEGPPSIAVAPFADLSPEYDQTHFVDGLSEELLNALGRLNGLRVFRWKVAARRVAMTAPGQHVLEGSVRRDGSRLRISVRLVDASDDSQLWVESYDRELGDIFAIQKEVADSVAATLQLMKWATGGVAHGQPR
jgi:TolB-like protein